MTYALVALQARWDYRVVLAFGLILAVLVVIGYRLINRDPSIQRSRFGFFVERERFPEEEVGEPPWPRSLPLDLDDTKEIPPKEET